MDTSTILPQSVLAAITLAGGGAGDRGAGARAECEGEFCSSQRLSSSCQGQGLVPRNWSSSSEVWADLPFKRVFSLVPRARTC